MTQTCPPLTRARHVRPELFLAGGAGRLREAEHAGGQKIAGGEGRGRGLGEGGCVVGLLSCWFQF